MTEKIRIRKKDAAPPPLTAAFELQPDAIVAALVDENARLVAQAASALPTHSTRAVVKTLTQLALELAQAEARGPAAIRAIGICVPGQIDPRGGRVTVPGWKNWTRVPLQSLLENALDEAGHDLRQSGAARSTKAQLLATGHPPITLAPRAAALAAAESSVGAARGKQHVVYFGLGAELECGLLVGGRVLAGADGLAGAAGWLAVGEVFKSDYETRGCLQTEGAPAALVRRALEEYGGDATSMLGSLLQETPEQLTPELIVRAARGGDQLAQQVVLAHCRWLGRGLANVVSLLNPEAIVLGGELGAALLPFLDDIRAETRQWAQPEAARACRIAMATVKRQAALIGAARLAQG